MSFIPIIDFETCSLSKSNKSLNSKDFERIGNQLFNAFRSVGFVYLKNSGINKYVNNKYFAFFFEQFC